MPRQFGEQRPRFLKLGERLQHALVQLMNGALRFRIESADGFDFVAEKLDAHGLGLFGREHIENAAADRVLAGHFHWIAALVADAFEVRGEVVERHFVMYAERLRELAVIGGASVRESAAATGARVCPCCRSRVARAQLRAKRESRRAATCSGPGSTSSAGSRRGAFADRLRKKPRPAKVCRSGNNASACLLPSTTISCGRPVKWCRRTA